ncbi:MAG: SulP family inorganic anion transporter [Patescibacteria group bacterium]
MTILNNIKSNWSAGLTVSLVSLPLSISLAVAANATPIMGVITAIWAGLFAAIFGGSHYNVVGPTGALSGILAMYAVIHGVGILPVLAVLGGILILFCYFFRFDRYIIFIPSSVIHGFTLGVAFIIGLNQFNFATGLQGLPVHERFGENIWESLKHFSLSQPSALIIFTIGLVLLFIFLKIKSRIPGPIAVAILGIILGYLNAKGMVDFPLQTLFTKFGDIESSLFHFSPVPWSALLDRHLLGAAATITVVAILETLISGKIAGAMTKTNFDSHREVLGLGIANLASGLFGGIPATAALARTALNVKTGATHRASGIINAVAVAIISLLLLPYFKYLPLPIVAAILVYVAVRMVEREHFVRMYRHNHFDLYLSLLVAAITIVADPIVGILLGATVALLYFVNQLSKAQSEVTVNKNKRVVSRVVGSDTRAVKQAKGEVIVYRFAGQMTYVNADAHIENVKRLTAPVIILGLRNLFYLDIDGLDALAKIVEELTADGRKVFVTGVGSAIAPFVMNAIWYKRLKKEKMVFESTSAALSSLGFVLGK